MTPTQPFAMPHSLDAEKGVLCSMILAPDIIDEIPITPEYFHLPAHRTIYTAMRELCASGKPIDFISLTQYLRDQKRLDKCGGAAAITDIGTFVVTPAAAPHYLEILREKYILRLLFISGSEIMQDGCDEAGEADAKLDAAEKKIFSIRADAAGEKNTVVHCKQDVLEAINQIELAYEHPHGIVGISTGIADWDAMTGGFRAGEMIVIAARPACGKSALGFQIAARAAQQLAIPTLFFSLEMPGWQLMQRSILSQAGVNIQTRRDQMPGKNDVARIHASANAHAAAPLYLDTTPGLTTAQFRSRSRKAKRNHGIGLIVVDYLQLMRATNVSSRETRQTEVSEISQTLKAVALELQVPVIALSQLSRAADEGKGSRPRLSHLRESGSIEQDADQVVLIHRLDSEKDNPTEQPYNTILILAKQRNGPTGDIKVNFLPQYTRFECRI